MWRKSWQMACREEDIPDEGDSIVYDIADDSLIVVRGEGGQIRAFHNSCLHRGTTLRESAGNVPELRCPFHGFTWNLDGSLKEIPCAWDFAHVDPETFCLPQARVGSWGGFVFVCMDPDGESLEAFLESLPDHFAEWPLEKRWKGVHVAKVCRANWKVVMEAFMESFHTMATHPQGLLYSGDANTEYDVYPAIRHFNRMVTAMGTPSPHLGYSVTEQDIVDQLNDDFFHMQGDALHVAEGETARDVLGRALRQELANATGVDLSDATTCEVLDGIQYFVFPNFFPWAGYGVPVVYRFRPNGNDVDTCIAEVMFLFPYEEGTERPRGVEIHWLDVDDGWTAAPELGGFGPIFNQDESNFARVQRGLKATRKPGVTLGNYQESRIRHFHNTLDDYLSVEPADRAE
jgi:phenylpropionate dioxygenase-like ring-hydroxylating dioxygenase large terminal subunit